MPETKNEKSYVFGNVLQDDNKPLSSAYISYSSDSEHILEDPEKPSLNIVEKTSQYGLFSLMLPVGKYQLVASAKGFRPIAKNIVTSHLEPVEVTFILPQRPTQIEYTGNKVSKELHTMDCPWILFMNDDNKIQFTSIETAQQKGFNGCSYCLKDYDTG